MGVFLFLLYFGNCYAQKQTESVINGSNYYKYLNTSEEVLYLSKEEIKIIVSGELRKLGVAQKNYYCKLISLGNKTTNLDKEKPGEVIACISGYPFLHMVYLEAGKLSVKNEVKLDNRIDRAGFRCNVFADPAEYPYITFKQSRYWYQQKTQTQNKEFVSRSVIVGILMEDIKQLVGLVAKK